MKGSTGTKQIKVKVVGEKFSIFDGAFSRKGLSLNFASNIKWIQAIGFLMIYVEIELNYLA